MENKFPSKLSFTHFRKCGNCKETTKRRCTCGKEKERAANIRKLFLEYDKMYESLDTKPFLLLNEYLAYKFYKGFYDNVYITNEDYYAEERERDVTYYMSYYCKLYPEEFNHIRYTGYQYLMFMYKDILENDKIINDKMLFIYMMATGKGD